VDPLCCMLIMKRIMTMDRRSFLSMVTLTISTSERADL